MVAGALYTGGGGLGSDGLAERFFIIALSAVISLALAGTAAAALGAGVGLADL